MHELRSKTISSLPLEELEKAEVVCVWGMCNVHGGGG